MVRILTCHHFQVQRTAKTEEPVGVAVVDDSVVVVGLEHRINIFYLSNIADKSKEFDLSIWLHKRRRDASGHGDFGGYFSFTKGQKEGSSPEHIPSKVGQSGELKLSHYFSPVGVLHYLEYNARGHFLVCLEKQESLISIRVYFKWDKHFTESVITARIAGLVSPTINRDSEENSLLMIEIPVPPSFVPKAVATCELTGNIATLSTDQRVSVYSYKVKEGRLKTQYGDFDLTCTVQLFGIIPDKILFVSNFIACLEATKAYVFRISRGEFNLNLPLTQPSSASPAKSDSTISFTRLNGFPTASSIGSHSDEAADGNKERCEKVVFDRRNDSVKVFLNTITRANRKKKQPNSFISEELQEEITLNKTGVIFSTSNAKDGYQVDDLLRVNVNNATESTENLLQMILHPIRVKDKLGGIVFIVATCKEAFLYHLPTKRESFPIREAIYTFTSSMLDITFDSLFFHVLTSSGVETFTSRHLYNALKDAEGFETFINDCPLHEESPVLIGMTPFINARVMACNEYCFCVMSCPSGRSGSSPTPSQLSDSGKKCTEQLKDTIEENLWTMYFLRCPTWEAIHQDITREAMVHQVSNPDAYFALISELYLILKATILKYPDTERDLNDRLCKTSRQIGYEYFKKSARESVHNGAVNDLKEKGITYLILGNCDVPFLFSSGPGKADQLKDPQLIPGIVKFIDVSLPRSIDDSTSATFSPALARQIVEFLALNDIKTLAQLTIHVSWLREYNAKRLLEILNTVISGEQFSEEDCLACILTIININGSYSKGRRQVKDVLDKMAVKQLKLKLNTTLLLERKKSQPNLTDLLICLSAANCEHHVKVLADGLKKHEVGILDVLLAFSQGVNLNSDVDVQKCLSKDLQMVLENYFTEKMSQNVFTQATSPTISREDEIRALHALVRSYLSHISVETHQALLEKDFLGFGTSDNQVHQAITRRDSSAIEVVVGAVKSNANINAKWLKFGKMPEFINYIIPELIGNQQPEEIGSVFSNSESKECFVKIASLLGSLFGRTPGLEELISTTISQKGTANTPVNVALKLLSESPDKAITTLMSSHPTVLMLYAKEMFGKSTRKWKLLIGKLKEKIKGQPDDVEIFSTIIESVYLHLANTLSPADLEHVLDKKEENAKFHSACARIDLANSFTAKIVTMSEEYLRDSK